MVQCPHSVSPDGTASLQAVLTGPGMAYLKSRVTFRCVAPNLMPPVTYELVKDGVVVDEGPASLRNESVAFSIKRVVPSTGGSYHCRATTAAPEGGGGQSNSIQLSVVSK